MREGRTSGDFPRRFSRVGWREMSYRNRKSSGRVRKGRFERSERLAPKMDRENERLVINSIHAEPGAPKDKEVALKIRETIENLAEFLGAKEVEYMARVPKPWRNSLR